MSTYIYIHMAHSRFSLIAYKQNFLKTIKHSVSLNILVYIIYKTHVLVLDMYIVCYGHIFNIILHMTIIIIIAHLYVVRDGTLMQYTNCILVYGCIFIHVYISTLFLSSIALPSNIIIVYYIYLYRRITYELLYIYL